MVTHASQSTHNDPATALAAVCILCNHTSVNDLDTKLCSIFSSLRAFSIFIRQLVGTREENLRMIVIARVSDKSSDMNRSHKRFTAKLKFKEHIEIDD